MAKHLTNTFYLSSEPFAAVIIKVIGLLLLVCDLLCGLCLRMAEHLMNSFYLFSETFAAVIIKVIGLLLLVCGLLLLVCDLLYGLCLRMAKHLTNTFYLFLEPIAAVIIKVIGLLLLVCDLLCGLCLRMAKHMTNTLFSEPIAAVIISLPLLVCDLLCGLCLRMAKHLTNTFYLFSELIAAVIIKAIGLLRLLCGLLYGRCRRFLDLTSYRLQHGKRDKERKNQEAENRDVAQEVAEGFVAESNGRYVDLKRLPDIGSRLQKYWFRADRCCVDGDRCGVDGDGCGVDGAEVIKVILSVTRVSTKCPVDLVKDMNTLNNKLFPEMKGPYIQPILEVRHYSEEQQLVVVQPFHSQGSLKDFIYDKSPITDWAHKYFTFSRSPPPPHIMAKYGKQILEAILFLYDHGFHQVGHVQTGNIFLEGDYCRLGGFENTVFGYKTRLTSLLTGHMESMDLVMFGHVIFEMACGYELTTLVPTSEDLERVYDSSLLDVIHLIFHMDYQGRFTSSIDKVLRHRFFQPTMSDTRAWRKPRLPHVTFINKEVKSILIKVKKGKALRTASDRKCRLQ